MSEDRLEEIKERIVRGEAWYNHKNPSHASYLRYYIDDVPYLINRVEELEQFKSGMFQELHDTEAELAKGLGYQHDEGYGWVVGDHTTVTLAMEAARRIRELEAEIERLLSEERGERSSSF